jgi:hypothetical protein
MKDMQDSMHIYGQLSANRCLEEDKNIHFSVDLLTKFIQRSSMVGTLHDAVEAAKDSKNKAKKFPNDLMRSSEFQAFLTSVHDMKRNGLKFKVLQDMTDPKLLETLGAIVDRVQNDVETLGVYFQGKLQDKLDQACSCKDAVLSMKMEKDEFMQNITRADAEQWNKAYEPLKDSVRQLQEWKDASHIIFKVAEVPSLAKGNSVVHYLKAAVARWGAHTITASHPTIVKGSPQYKSLQEIYNDHVKEFSEKEKPEKEEGEKGEKTDDKQEKQQKINPFPLSFVTEIKAALGLTIQPAPDTSTKSAAAANAAGPTHVALKRRRPPAKRAQVSMKKQKRSVKL